MTDKQLESLLTLYFCPGIGDVKARKILQSSDDFFLEYKSLIASKKAPKTLSEINSKEVKKNVEKELDNISKYGIQVCSYMDLDYPELLKGINDAPLLLFYKGSIKTINQNTNLSIVGTRNYSSYGKGELQKLIASWKGTNVNINSGLALGIDKLSHTYALENGLNTFAVMGNGLSSVYPSSHVQLAEEIISNGGAIITELTYNAKPDRQNFPKRNRIVAGMSLCTIVIESAVKGGSMITAELANGYNREVYALPGRTTDLKSQGCNHLIAQNKASPLISPDSIQLFLENRNLFSSTPVAMPDLTEKELGIYNFIRKEKKHIDDILRYTQLGISELNALLFEMEMKNCIQHFSGNYYGIK